MIKSLKAAIRSTIFMLVMLLLMYFVAAIVILFAVVGIPLVAMKYASDVYDDIVKGYV